MNNAPAPVSFAADILPLFTSIDIAHMQPMGVFLNQYSYMSDPTNNHQNAIPTGPSSSSISTPNG